MGFITAGYDGTVDEVQFAKLLPRYSVVGAEDFKATTQAGDRIVAISDGTALGPGTMDVATAIPNIQFAAAAAGTTRWDLVALRRDWQPPGGSSSIVIVQGGTTKGYPAVGTAGTAWNRRPGIVDDQPLYLQEVNGTLLGSRVDLRVWNGGGGLYAKDDLVRSYLDVVGAEINISGVTWRCQLGDNDAKQWVSVAENEVGFVITTDTNWGYSGGLIRAVGIPRTHVHLSLRMARGAGGAVTLNTSYLQICNLIPAGWTPGTVAFGNANVHTAGGIYKFTCPFAISTTGDLLMQVNAGSGTINIGDYFNLDVGWHR